jgi:hypothetical protein
MMLLIRFNRQRITPISYTSFNADGSYGTHRLELHSGTAGNNNPRLSLDLYLE